MKLSFRQEVHKQKKKALGDWQPSLSSHWSPPGWGGLGRSTNYTTL